MNNTIAEFAKETRGKGERRERESGRRGRCRQPAPVDLSTGWSQRGSLFAPAADKSTVLEYYKTLESHTPTRGNGWKGGTSMEWTIGKANAKAAKKVERA